MSLEKKIVIASDNKGKGKELSRVIASTGVKTVLQSEIGISSIKETKTTFIENAIDKARHAVANSGCCALADDSGLVVPALGGLPGIYSARFSGPRATDGQNIIHLLNRMAGLSGTDRRAHFICVLVVLKSIQDPSPIIIERKWYGKILFEPSGENGFGYDSIFGISNLHNSKISAADLDIDQKNCMSHRGQALQGLVDYIKECY